MFLKRKKKVTELLETVSEMLSVLYQLKNPNIAIYDCLSALETILLQLENEDIKPFKTIEQLKSIEKSFNSLLNNSSLFIENYILILNNQVKLLKILFNKEVKGKLNIAFFPYKASMWDSLESVYEAAAKDSNCVARVVPIPYYELTNNESNPKYEGGRFPTNIPITHYSEYKLEEEEPDIIFVHNIYDDFNTLTRVYEDYYTSNLKKYTEMLVYVPYYISSFIPFKKGKGFYPYNLPSLKNIDKVIYVNEHERIEAIRAGIPEEKILVLGSPKIDSMIKSLRKSSLSSPPEWKKQLEGNTVYLVNTGCLYFANNPFIALEKLLDIFNITRFVDNTVVIWRPHPLTFTSILKYTPYFKDYYFNLTERCLKEDDEFYKNIIFDKTDNYVSSIQAADVLISNDSSILNSYLLTEKKVLFWDEKMPEDSLLPSNVFYYALNSLEPWYKLAKKFNQGYDPLAVNRKGLASKVYVNVDGTCGAKVYQAIKRELLKVKI